MDDIRLRELLEARRPGSLDGEETGLDDIELELLREAMAHDPELAAELARVQAWDERIEEAFPDVAIPAGLEARLLAAAKAEGAEEVVLHVDEAVAARPSAQEPPAVAPVSPMPSRLQRRALWGVLATLAATLLLALGLWSRPEPEPIASEALVQEALATVPQLEADVWQRDLAAAPLPAYPLDRAVRARAIGWRPLPVSHDRQSVAYELINASGHRAVLQVLRVPARSTSDLPSAPSLQPRSNTQGYCIGAWEQNGYVYVLTVPGNASRYASFLRSPLAEA